MLANIRQILADLLSLFYPRCCFACGNPLVKNEECLCTDCSANLPETDFHVVENNPVANQFFGKIDFNAAASCYYFTKGGKVQHLVHQFKYMGYKEIGLYVGKAYGLKLKESPYFTNIDFIIPVPLHPKREKARGYNQAEWFANGLSQSLEARVNTKALKRVIVSETQTSKGRYKRWENVKEIFSLGEVSEMENKHLLLVDDVITTGSTLESAGHVLQQIPGVKISVCSLACALH